MSENATENKTHCIKIPPFQISGSQQTSKNISHRYEGAVGWHIHKTSVLTNVWVLERIILELVKYDMKSYIRSSRRSRRIRGFTTTVSIWMTYVFRLPHLFGVEYVSSVRPRILLRRYTSLYVRDNQLSQGWLACKDGLRDTNWVRVPSDQLRWTPSIIEPAV